MGLQSSRDRIMRVIVDTSHWHRVPLQRAISTPFSISASDEPSSMPSTVSLMLRLLALLAASCATPLDDYVNAPDPTYEYRDLGDPWKGGDYTSYFINLTSQMWLSREWFSSILASTSYKLVLNVTLIVLCCAQLKRRVAPSGGTIWS